MIFNCIELRHIIHEPSCEKEKFRNLKKIQNLKNLRGRIFTPDIIFPFIQS